MQSSAPQEVRCENRKEPPREACTHAHTPFLQEKETRRYEYDEEDDSPVAEALLGSKFLQKSDLLALFRQLGVNLNIPMEDDFPCPCSGLFQQFHSRPLACVAVNKEVLDLLVRELKDPEKADPHIF
ncbi:hypothetical protein NDU88_003271 [Pleurodeles waltl]|uniref:Uncharacterized protein n=1 Tax=Pleurodeles waltl TaxID=8319 RepID=A0AAV7MQQ3_PLEWA|nr:hypothetical protein NDU88_003271 [Pleurodeles waltl]